MLLQDVWFLEKLAHFDREVIPERRMHAKGSGAYGTFTVTHDITKYTKAKIFSAGRQEDRPLRALLHRGRRARRGRRRARHPRLRDQVLHRGRQLGPGRQQHAGLLPARPAQVPGPQPRGEARPAHQPAQREEQLGLLDLAARGAAPDHHHHERPRASRYSYRHMHGFGSHTFSLINAKNERFWVKFHLRLPAGHQEPDRRRGRGASSARTARATSATCTRASRRATSRAGRCSSR